MLTTLLLVVPSVEPYGGHIITTGGGIIIALIGALAAYLTARLEKIGSRVRRTEQAAQLAAQRSEPTGNGYAARTETALNELLALANDLRAGQQDHTTRLARLERHVLDKEIP